MTYAGVFLMTSGQSAIINRITGAVATYIDLKKMANSIGRTSYYSGLILASSGLQSGELITSIGVTYLILKVLPDSNSGELQVEALTTNIESKIMTRKRIADENMNVKEEWVAKGTTKSYCEVVTAATRQYEVGILDKTEYILYLPKTTNLQLKDRIEIGKNYEILSMDEIQYPGVYKLQLAVDLRK